MGYMKYNVLLGATDDNLIVFANIGKCGDRLSISFDTVRPLNLSKFNLEKYCEETFDRGALGDDNFLDLIVEYDCPPSELPSYIASNWDISEILDISLYPETITVGEDDYVFESDSCGQVDEYVNVTHFLGKEASDIIYNTWKEYHLKPIPEDKEAELIKAVETLLYWDEAEWIRDYIENN